MKTFSIYNAETGVFIEGLKAIEGDFDPQTQRVDPATDRVVDYQPPPPSLQHKWNANAKRWEVDAETARRQKAVEDAKTEINKLEQTQLRTVCEIVIDANNDIPDIRSRLRSVENQKIYQRKIVQANS